MIRKLMLLVVLFCLCAYVEAAPAWGDVTPSSGQCSSPDPAQCQSPSPSPSPSSSSSPGTSSGASPSPSPSPTSSSSSTGSSSQGTSSNSGILGFFASVWDSISSIVSIILGSISNPLGAINGLICRVIDGIASVWPSTPDNFKISSILVALGQTFPIVGYGVLLDIAQTIASVFLLFVVIKIYKLIPFKAS